MFDTWLRTVLGLSTRVAATSVLLRPAAIRSSTSCSREVSSGNTASGTARGRGVEVDRAGDRVRERRDAVEPGPPAGDRLVGRGCEEPGAGVERLQLERLARPDPQERL